MIHAGNEKQDILGDLVKQPQAGGYDPRQWQDAANGQSKNRVFMHGSGSDAVEVVERPALIPRMIALPETDAEAIPVLERFFESDSELRPHAQAVITEVRNIARKAPTLDRSDTFNLAVARVCKANNLPLEREAPLPHPLENSRQKTERGELKRLEAEARKVRTPVGRDPDSDARALQETAPRPTKRK